ncbi:SAM-dependent methyltransferase [Heyndrickxia ginsengihumi]|uniref:SAM-dependent methyltransferase n=1 Tax=Heyndrickxia ginsengihumi TaxID=363870 RepID=UPI003D22CA6D
MNEQYYDGLLNIKTIGEQKGFSASFHYHRYEPTPYQALERLLAQYELRSTDRLIDFGCGKGRLNFFINHVCRASVVGIEMNETFYQQALKNKIRYLKKHGDQIERIHFQCCLAEEYLIEPSDNRFYFFNPFSVQIFMKVIHNILQSVEENPRDVELILYYASDDYRYFLDNQTIFELKDEIILPHLYEHNPYEKFLIYRLAY